MLPALFRKIFQKRKVTVILYHDCTASSFERHVQFLTKKYNIISIKQFLEYKDKNMWDSLPDYPAIITFDDGHKDNYKLLDIIKKNKLPISIFLTAGIIDTDKEFWFLNKNLDKKKKQELKKINNKDRVSILNSELKHENSNMNRQALNISEINTMKEYVDFQSHTMTHPCLPNCTDEESLSEIKNSRSVLNEMLNQEIHSIAYPNGDYSDREKQFCLDSGYLCAFTVNPGYNSMETNSYELFRFSATDNSSIYEMFSKVSGFWWYLKKYIKLKSN